MEEYKIQIDGEVLEGYNFQECITGEAKADMIQRFTNEHGQSFFMDKGRREVEDLIEKVKADPAAYKESILATAAIKEEAKLQAAGELQKNP